MEAKSGATDRLRRVAWILDDLVRIPGTSRRVGIDPLLGLIPGGGDLAAGAMSAYILLSAARLGAPSSVILRMGGNILLDTVLGAVPLLGDLFDASWKANRRNVALLDRYVAEPTAARRSSRLLVAVVLIVVIAAIIGIAAVGVLAVRALIHLF